MNKTVSEPVRKIPVVREVDVVVAGAGVSGVFAALGAAKEGASVLLVDRFGDLGGNMGGPGLIMWGGTTSGLDEDFSESKWVRFLSKIPRDFSNRALALLGEGEQPYPVIAHVFSRVAFEMASEAGIELMLSAYASDPVMDGNEVHGLVVETKSGRVAVAAKVVIDATGDASIADRAGAPVRHRQRVLKQMASPAMHKEYIKPEYKYWNDSHLMYLVTGVDWVKYDAWRWPTKEKEWGPGDREFFDAHFEEEWNQGQKALVPILRAYEERGDLILKRDIRPLFHTEFQLHWVKIGQGLLTGTIAVNGEWDTGDWKDISLAEEHARTHAFDGTRFMKDNAPGFENVEIVSMAAFLGARGGPHIIGEHFLTVKEGVTGMRYPDTMFVSHMEVDKGAPEPGNDAPYGMIVPQKIDGLLVTARGASWMRRGHDPGFRGRRQMMYFGQAAGIAAALACRDGVTPRDLDVKKLQTALLAEGFFLGDEERLAELGLA